jgi:hypothetical protein
MNRRATLVTGMTLLGLTIAALPQPGLAQSDPFLGTWHLNLAKSKFNPGPAPRSQTRNFQAEGQNLKLSITGINANGNPINAVATLVFDGMPHPANNPNFDANAAIRVDAYTAIFSFTKAGKLVETLTTVVSPDGKMYTATGIGIDANGRPFNDI